MWEMNEEARNRVKGATPKSESEVDRILSSREQELNLRLTELRQRQHELSSWEMRARLAEREMTGRFILAQRSQWFALVSLLAALATTLTLALTGHDNVAITVITVTVVPVVGLYITGKYADRKNYASGQADTTASSSVRSPDTA